MGIKKSLRSLLIDLDQRWDSARLSLLRSLGRAGELTIIPYRGIGSPRKLLLRGRVLVYRTPPRFDHDDDLWDDLVNMYRRLNTTEIPGAVIRASAAGSEIEVVSDDEGFFEVELQAGDSPFTSPRQIVELTLLHPESDARVVASAEVVVRTPDTQFLIISDIDDTVVHTQATNLLAMARATFLGNAASRTPFKGVAALYRALADGVQGDEKNPLVFVSRSPWNLYDLFDQFCDLQGVPAGRVFFLRDWGFSLEGLSRAKTRGHKFDLIQQILEVDASLPVILIGDSGQKDPEIYLAIVEENPGRIIGCFIRNVSHRNRRLQAIDAVADDIRARGAACHLFEDSLDLARHIAALGCIRPEAVPKVAGSMGDTGDAPDALEELITRPPGDSPGGDVF